MTHLALIIIDMQNAYFQNGSLAGQQATLISRANELIDAAMDRGLLVINVVTQHTKDGSTWTLNMREDEQGYLLQGDEEAKTVAGLRVEGAWHIAKTRDSAFFGTDLAPLLREHGIETIVLVGVSTHICILQTAADAYANNFKVILSKDAIGTHDPKYHRQTLELLEQEYRQPARSNTEIIALMEQAR